MNQSLSKMTAIQKIKCCFLCLDSRIMDFMLCFVCMKRASPLFSYSDFKRGAGRGLVAISEGNQTNELDLYV